MENLENNKLIATFLNWDVDSIGRYDTPFFVNIDGEEESFLTLTELCFSYDWNWLMLAVEKCKERQIFGSQGLINNIDKRLLQVDLLATYGNVISFIEFYNIKKSI